MQSVCIIANQNKDKNGYYTGLVQTVCRKSGLKTRVAPVPEKESGFQYIDPADIGPDTDLLIVLGGDGTLLSVSRETRHLGIPLLGVNLGTLGYLTEVPKDEIELAIAQIAAGDYRIEERMMLRAQMMGMPDGVAVNDVVFGRLAQTQITFINLYVNGRLLHSYEADGLIISTPTGSTAYNLSAGGPVVEPTASMFVVTPICPHTLGLGSIVLSGEDLLEVEFLHSQRHPDAGCGITFDGEPMIPLANGVRIRLTRAEETMKLCKLSSRSFIDILRTKMQR